MPEIRARARAPGAARRRRAEEAALRRQVEAAGSHAVIFAGRVPHEEVPRYYDLVDVLVYPRSPMRLTELVTPLKPLEAMAQGRLVVASDVGGHVSSSGKARPGSCFRRAMRTRSRNGSTKSSRAATSGRGSGSGRAVSSNRSARGRAASRATRGSTMRWGHAARCPRRPEPCAASTASFSATDSRCRPELMARMGQLTVHRGPDDEGMHLDGACAIGMRRLSIIDLAGGHQPLVQRGRHALAGVQRRDLQLPRAAPRAARRRATASAPAPTARCMLHALRASTATTSSSA